MKKLGFIGMGIMGLPMATNILQKREESIVGFDVMEEARMKFMEAGGEVSESIPEIAANSDIVFLCLPKNELVESVGLEVISNAKVGTIIVDCSSTAPNIIRGLYPKVKAAGMHLIDAPVSGGQIGAIEGSLAIMCGGDKDIFDIVEEYLACMGAKVTYVGATGCGDVAKLANNMIVGNHLLAMGEAFAFATKAGLDPAILFEAIKDGYAQSRVLDVKVGKMLERDFTPAARIAVHQKDMKNAMQMASEMGVEIPLSAIVLEYMNRMEADGLINEDQCALVKPFEKDMQVVVK